MKNTVSRILSVILAICMVVSLMPSVWATENADTVEIKFLVTSDIHGQLYATDYTADVSKSGTYSQGLTRAATYIKQVQESTENLYLADLGDTVQGTPLTYYFAFEEDTMADPTIKALRTLDYDMWVLGNHEFNYGMDIMMEQINYAISPAADGESQLTMSMANYLAAETNSDESKNWATWNGYAPYVIEEYDGVKVAIMGIGNPGIPMWDVPANWEGIYFANPIETYRHYEAEMEEAADLIVLMSHSGIGGSTGGDGTGYMEELIQTFDSVDLIFSGHEHKNGTTMVTNPNGVEVPIVSPSTKAAVVSEATFVYNKADGTYTLDTKNNAVQSGWPNYTPYFEVDSELEAVLKPYEEAAWNDYMLQPIGTASGDFSASGLGSAPSAFMDLINRVQLAYAYDYNGQNTPDDPSDDQMAQLSISAPLTSGDAANLIPAGDIVLGDMFRLYRYENWFYQIRMTGKEVRTWLEFAATKLNDEGEVTGYDLTYYDVIYGEGFSYTLDYGMPEGNRVTSMTYNGEEVADDQEFTVVVNNYRYNGGGNYVAYLNEHGCNFIANDESRIIYSTQYDMIQGEDQGQARNMLANYIREKGTIAPEITSTWKVENTVDYSFAVVSTTDMHGRSTKFDVATQKEDQASMVRAATIIKALREQYGDDMILVDNGDTIQGNLAAQYAINYETAKLNPMIEIMADLGYDAWVMGNHEFNFNDIQRDTQVKYAADAEITTISANITLIEDGKNFADEDAKAGDVFYEPYIIKTLSDDDGNEIKVAIIGFGNSANATWDIATNYPNMQFQSSENPTGDLSYEFDKWISYVQENEEVDFIVVSSHNGFGTAENPALENQTQYATANTSGADLVICGHDHTPRITTVTNQDGKSVPVVNAGGSNVNLNTFNLTVENGEIVDVKITTENIALADVAGDEETAAKTQHWYDETYAWASAPVGTFDNGWTELADQFTGKTNNQMVTFQNALVDFVHKGQIWASWQSYEDLGIEGATVSIGSAVFAEDWSNGNRGVLGFVPVDGTTISTLELNKLYRYSNNLLCAIDMTGEQLWNWMNTTVDYYDVDENGNIYLNSSVFGTDTFYGVDYTVDLTKPYGERLVSATYQGQDLKTYEGLIRCTLNSYRLSGGYGFFEATGLTEADCCWTASMYLGSDRAPVPTMLGEYVAHMGTVTPNDKVSHGADSTWTIITESEDAFEDVPADSFYYDAVQWAAQEGITTGVTETTFVPDRDVTRAEVVTFLWRAAGEPVVESDKSFPDVAESDFFYNAVIWAAENGITKGKDNGLFDPYATCTRAEAITFLWRAKGEPEINVGGGFEFADVEPGAFYAYPVMWALENGITNGIDAENFGPYNICNRAHIVTFLYRAK